MTTILVLWLCCASAGAAEYTIVTVAGSGAEGFGGDGGDARCAQLNRPSGVDVDTAGFVFIADYSNHRVRRVAPDGTITTVAGTGVRGFSGDGGAATSAQLAGPYSVRVIDDGFLIADAMNGRIRHVDGKGIIRTVAGGEPGVLQHPIDVVIGPDRAMYVAEGGGNRVRRIVAGVVETVAGSGRRRYNGLAWLGGDGGTAKDAVLNVPAALAFDREGALYIADLRNHAVRRVSRDGIIKTIAGNGKPGDLEQPGGMAFDADGNLLVSDLTRIHRLSKDGQRTTIAGSGRRGFSGDHGPAANAEFSVMDHMTIDRSGNIFVADHRNNRIRKLIPVRKAAEADVRRSATPDVEALLAKMRAAYLAVRSAEMKFRSERGHGRAIAGSLEYRKPSHIVATLDVPQYGNVRITASDDTITVNDPLLDAPEVLPWSLQNARTAMAVNLEVISLWDAERQLSTGPGGNMRGEDLKIAGSESWRGRDWTILEEASASGWYRYYIDPKTFLIWRTLATESGHTMYDGTVEELRAAP